MDKKNDDYWFNEILRIEKEKPYAERFPNNEKDLSFTNAKTEEQLDDYFMIDNRFEYLRFVRNHKAELSKDSYLWLIDDIPNCVVDDYRIMLEDLENLEREAV